MRKPIVILAFVAAALVLVCPIFLADVVPPKSTTYSRIMAFRYRVCEYYEKHQKLPASLSDLPPRDGYDNETSDAWHRQIEYKSQGMSVTLRSLGKDGKTGGSGDDEDIQVDFTVGENGKGCTMPF